MLIDLHAHILPGIDDGPPDMAGSVELARAAVAAGARVMTATPHMRADHPDVRPDELASRCEELQRTLDAEGVDLSIVPGAEVDLTWALSAGDEELRLASYGQRGTDVLIETPYGYLPPTFEALLERIRSRGYRILLAHPERNPAIQADPERLLRLVEDGVLVQITGLSLTSRRSGSRSERLARQMLEHGAVHAIASDAHRNGPPRGPDLRAAFEVAAGYGAARAQWLAFEAPAAIVAGDPLPAAPPPLRRRRWALGSLRDRRRAAVLSPTPGAVARDPDISVPGRS